MAFFFRPKQFDPRIKPKQWGPLSDVQAAVRHNCERLGIDYEKLLALWPLWEQAGSLIYNYGSYGGSYIAYNSPTWEKEGLKGNGSNAYVDFGSDYSFGSNPFSLVQWVFGGDDVDRFSISSRTGSTAYGYEFLIGAGSTPGYWGFRAKGTTAYPQLNVDGGWNDGKWHLLVGTASPSASQFYVDGNLEDSGGTPGTIDNSQNLMLFRRGTTYATVLTGTTIVYADVLTADQITQLYEQPYALIVPVSRPVYFDLGESC